jgi:hypothetical protein
MGLEDRFSHGTLPFLDGAKNHNKMGLEDRFSHGTLPFLDGAKHQQARAFV